ANDLAGLFAACPQLSHVFFNGSAAETAFRRHAHLPHGDRGIRVLRLPSTSPAHAALNYSDKLAAWQAVRNATLTAAHAA
ncbi:MAG: DNA-deoxyinosine glycosylase, partial [Betaproteobacteria bacterium HGW-Betaproteobacteria-21]